MQQTKNIIEKSPVVSSLSGAEALRAVVEKLRKNLSASLIADYRFGALFSDEGEQHSPRRAWMSYDDVYMVKMGKGGWIFAFGEPAGKSYLFEDMEADIVLIRSPDWPICKEVLWKLIRYNPIMPHSKGDKFRFTFLASQEGRIVQRYMSGLDLSAWTQEKFGDGKKTIVKPLSKYRSDTQCFSPFLPDALKFDANFITSISSKLAEYMLNN